MVNTGIFEMNSLERLMTFWISTSYSDFQII